MILDLSYYSALGNRKNNEDAVSVMKNAGGLLAIVADGLGGQDNGEYASWQAVNTLKEALSTQTVSTKALEEAIAEANRDICVLQSEHPGAQTTIAVIWLGGAYAEAMHVGDTRIYQFRGDSILYQSVDHSVAQLSVMAGELRPEEIRTHRDRNKLFRALGDTQMPKIAKRRLDVQKGDRLLLCSDGFWEGIVEKEMLRLARLTTSAEAWLTKMREIAEPAARDNNTAIAIIIQ